MYINKYYNLKWKCNDHGLLCSEEQGNSLQHTAINLWQIKYQNKKIKVSLAFKGSDKNWNERKQTWNKYYFQIIGNISSSYYLCMVRVEMNIKIESFNC